MRGCDWLRSENVAGLKHGENRYIALVGTLQPFIVLTGMGTGGDR